MKKIRAINGYFESSTQAMTKLKEFQRTSNIVEYRNHRDCVRDYGLLAENLGR